MHINTKKIIIAQFEFPHGIIAQRQDFTFILLNCLLSKSQAAEKTKTSKQGNNDNKHEKESKRAKLRGRFIYSERKKT